MSQPDPPLPETPYRGIESFRFLDRAIFPARNEEVWNLLSCITLYRASLLYGEPGTGKSSLVNAGLIPQTMRENLVPHRLRVLPKEGGQIKIERISTEVENGPPYLPSVFATDEAAEIVMPLEAFLQRLKFCCKRKESLSQASGDPSVQERPLLIFDQFEELITHFEEALRGKELAEARLDQAAIIKTLVELIEDETLLIKLLFVFREDYLAKLDRLFVHAPDLTDQFVRLVPPDVSFLGEIIRTPIDRFPGRYGSGITPELTSAIVQDIERRNEGAPINLSEVEIACLGLWKSDDPQSLFDSKGVQGLLEDYLTKSLSQFDEQLRPAALAILSRLLTSSNPPTRNVVSEEELIEHIHSEKSIDGEKIREASKKLVETRLVRKELRRNLIFCEIVSEFLVPWIIKERTAQDQAEAVKKAAREAEEREREAASMRELEVHRRARRQAELIMDYLLVELRNSLALVGRLDLLEAVQTVVEAYYEWMAEAEESDVMLHRRAMANEMKGDILVARGNLEGALESYRKRHDTAERLAARDPANTRWRSDLSVSYEKIGDVQMAQGDPVTAANSYQKSLGIREELAASDPADTRWRSDLSASYEKIGDVQMAHSDWSRASSSYQKGLEIMEGLAADDPTNTQWQHELSVSYEKIGDVQMAQGDLPTALSSYQKSLQIRTKLAEHDPANPRWQRDLSVSYSRIGDVRRIWRELPAAFGSYKKSLEIAERLAAFHPANTQWQRDLPVNYEKIGDVQRTQGDLPNALGFYRKSLEIREKLAGRDPTDTGSQRDLSVIYEKIGDLQKQRRELSTAADAYQKSLEIRKKLTEHDLANSQWQRDLSVSYEKIGDLQMTQGDLPAALGSYQKGLEIRERLAARDPSNGQWQRDVSVSYEKIADLQMNQGDLPAALSSCKKSLEPRKKLAERDPTNAQWQRDLSVSYEKIAIVQSMQGDLENSASSYKNSYRAAAQTNRAPGTQNMELLAEMVSAWQSTLQFTQQIFSPDHYRVGWDMISGLAQGARFHFGNTGVQQRRETASERRAAILIERDYAP